MRNLIIVRGLAGDLYWTGDTWCADPRLAYRYSADERNILELPRGGYWTTAPLVDSVKNYFAKDCVAVIAASCYTVFTTTGKETNMNVAAHYQEKARHWAHVAMYARDVLGQVATSRDAQENAAHYARYAREALAFYAPLDK